MSGTEPAGQRMKGKVCLAIGVEVVRNGRLHRLERGFDRGEVGARGAPGRQFRRGWFDNASRLD